MGIFRLDSKALRESVYKWSRRAGRSAARPVLLMWYVMRDKATPRADKWAIFASLAYLVLPVDVLDAKRLPVIGWLDEVASLAVLVQKMSKRITPEMEARADRVLGRWFPDGEPQARPVVEYADYELLEG